MRPHDARVALALAKELVAVLTPAADDGRADRDDDLPPVDPWIALHRPGTRCKIDRDPELEAFVRARLDRMTLVAIVAEIARCFPPDRRVSESSMQRWWKKRCSRGPA